jgi:DNA-binding transcriptional MerR regulator
MTQISGLRRGQVAAAADVNIETLRYYERRGLLAEPERSPGGHRLYPSEAVTVLRVIKAAQRLGFTLDEVAGLLELGKHRHGKRIAAGLQRQAKAKLAEIDERIADLVTIRENLTAALDAGCDDLMSCESANCCPIPFEAIAVQPSSVIPVRRSVRTA